MFIEINVSQIRTLGIKREKVCALCPNLLFLLLFSATLVQTVACPPLVQQVRGSIPGENFNPRSRRGGDAKLLARLYIEDLD